MSILNHLVLNSKNRPHLSFVCCVFTCATHLLLTSAVNRQYVRLRLSQLKTVLLYNFTCLSFTLQSDLCTEFVTRRLFSHSSSEGRKLYQIQVVIFINLTLHDLFFSATLRPKCELHIQDNIIKGLHSFLTKPKV